MQSAQKSVTENQDPDSTESLHYSDFVYRQQQEIPRIYESIDFDKLPYRFSTDLADQTQIPTKYANLRKGYLANSERLKIIRDYTMVGDKTADAYASLIPEYGFKRLVEMLEQALLHGIDTVENAPEELHAFMSELETVPDWVDMDLVEEGAKYERIRYANVSPYVIRGGLLATFVNKYTALPMAITGTFASETSAKRVFETASFFAATIMPGALERDGKGLYASAKVRLMHSMVRYNIMRRGKWDTEVYGVPIPQVDQMPAGMFSMFLMAEQVLKSGGTEFNAQQRARVELARYRCYLLGLPEVLLETTPQGIFDVWMTRLSTLRTDYDSDTCGKLLKSTMEADISGDFSIRGRLHTWLERGFSKTFFLHKFLNGDIERAKEMGVKIGLSEKIGAVFAGIIAFGQFKFYSFLDKLPMFRGLAERRIVDKMTVLLDSYGHADFVTDASQYRT